MDRVGARPLRGPDVLLGVEVRRDLDRLVRRAGVQRAGVVGRRDRDGRDPELAAGAEDADGDLAAVRYEELPDPHAGGRFSRNARRPSWPSSLVRRSAARATASSSPGGSSTSRFASRTAIGPPASRSATTRSTAASRSAATSWTRPIRSAVCSVEPLAGEEVAPRRRGADPGEHQRRDHRRDDPEPHLREPEHGVLAGDGDVGAGGQPRAAAERVALHAGDHRRRAAEDRLEHPVEPAGVLDVLLVGEIDRGALPLDVGAGAEARRRRRRARPPGRRRRRRTPRPARGSALRRTRCAARAARA